MASRRVVAVMFWMRFTLWETRREISPAKAMMRSGMVRVGWS
jgi:hypothetical protein